MEKRNYLKPTTDFHAINTAPFMVGSSVILDEESFPDQGGSSLLGKLDDCLTIGIDIDVDNDHLSEYLEYENGTVGSFWKYVDSDSSCSLSQLADIASGTAVKITSLGEGKYLIETGNCTPSMGYPKN